MNEPRRENDLQIGLLDRLAAGDLDGSSRRELFTWLDREPGLWRRCALALLEARELEQALGDWKAEARSRGTALPGPISNVAEGAPCRDGLGRPSCAETTDGVSDRLGDRHGRPRRIPAKRSRGEWLALAASVLAAFASGIAVRGLGTAPEQTVAQAPRETARHADPAKDARSAQRAAVSGQAADSKANVPLTPHHSHLTPQPLDSAERLPAYVRSQLERRGYRVD
ncbi:MAG TPA: hypothetical protein VND64_22390, partial [Pirellulales bacterium]|nr:hypothetical protein [Pirellulales bacterium]